MKHFSSILLLLVSLNSFTQNVTDVDFYQDGNKVIICYSLDEQADIEVLLSSDGGKTFSVPLKCVFGDVGKNVTAGQNNRIIWDALSERDNVVGNNFVFKIRPAITQKSFTVNGVTFEMIRITGGTFIMGATQEQGNVVYDDERPIHNVTLSYYYIGKFEVSQRLWQAVMGSNPSWFKGDNHPVEQVSWNDIQTFFSKLNTLTGKHFSLPTEAQWEYAARGGNKSNRYKYSGSNTISDVAWHPDISNGTTHEIGTKLPNELGLFDMSGNVTEWCLDRNGLYNSNSQTNPTGPTTGSRRIHRGGCGDYGGGYCRVSVRYSSLPDHKSNFLGFRIALIP